MPKEIEKKFLVKEIPSKIKVGSTQQIIQNYLAIGNEEVRIRLKKEQGKELDLTLAIKRGSGLEREEITNVISFETYKQLSASCLHLPIIKERSIVPYGLYTIEIDTYANKQLIVAEVEFESVAMAKAFIPPIWFGQDVTEDKDYKNQNLWKQWQSV